MTERLQVDPRSLERLLREFRDLPPKVKTGVRRELRAVGDDVIAAQRSILDGPLPRGVKVSGRSTVFAKNRKTGRTYLRRVNTYADTDVERPGRSTGLRERIKEGLATRVVTGKTRQGIDIRNTNRKAEMSTGWNSKRFRHPVFGSTDKWVYQAGQPYFFGPVMAGRDDLLRRAEVILTEALKG